MKNLTKPLSKEKSAKPNIEPSLRRKVSTEQIEKMFQEGARKLNAKEEE